MRLYQDLHQQVKFSPEDILFPVAGPAISAILALYPTASFEYQLNIVNRKSFTKLHGKPNNLPYYKVGWIPFCTNQFTTLYTCAVYSPWL